MLLRCIVYSMFASFVDEVGVRAGVRVQSYPEEERWACLSKYWKNILPAMKSALLFLRLFVLQFFC